MHNLIFDQKSDVDGFQYFGSVSVRGSEASGTHLDTTTYSGAS